MDQDACQPEFEQQDMEVKTLKPVLLHQEVIYLFWVPVVLGTSFGWYRLTLGLPESSFDVRLPLFWATFILVAWVVNWLGCKFVHHVFRRWRPPLFFILVTGSVFGSLVTFVPAQDIVGEFLKTFVEFPPVQGSSLGIDKVVQSLSAHPRGQ